MLYWVVDPAAHIVAFLFGFRQMHAPTLAVSSYYLHFYYCAWHAIKLSTSDSMLTTYSSSDVTQLLKFGYLMVCRLHTVHVSV